MRYGSVFVPTQPVFGKEQNGIFVPDDSTEQCDVSSIYVSNRSICSTLLTKILNDIYQHAESLKKFTDAERKFYEIRLISCVLTQHLSIFVRHDNFLYVYNGKIYGKILDPATVYPMIREICEHAATLLETFQCTARIVERIYAEIEQTAIAVDYPADIHNLIVFQNGILNLTTMQLEPFMTGRFITNMIMVDWVPGNDCPRFHELLQVYTQGDAVLKERLLEALGICLTNDIVKKIICFLGVSHSGKSFLVNFLMDMINPEAVHVLQPNDFERQFATSQIHEKCIIACMDMEAAPLNPRATATLKNISGHDRINFELKHANGGHTFVSRAHVILCSNYNIVPQKEDAAFEMRKLVVPFDHRLNEEAVSQEELIQTLESEKSAIVYLLIQAVLRLRARNYVFSGGTDYDHYVPMNGIGVPKEVCFQLFFEQCCQITGLETDYVFTRDLYQAYMAFCKEHLQNDFLCYNAFSKLASKQLSNLQHGRKYRVDHPEGNAESCYLGVQMTTSFRVTE